MTNPSSIPPKLTSDKRPDIIEAFTKPDELGLVPAWSYSGLKVFETCPYRTYISKVKKVYEEAGPAAERGSRIHQLAEDYVQTKIGDLPDELKKFTSQFQELRDLFVEGKVEVEGEWGFTLDWNATGWMAPDTWARVKLDAIVHETETSARVIDHKTGKKFGNEIAHGQQALTYAIGTFFRYPLLEHVQTELWYLDQAETTTQAYTRDEAMVFAPGLHQRALKMTTATDFPPNPGKDNCRWCPFKEGEYPICEWGIK